MNEYPSNRTRGIHRWGALQIAGLYLVIGGLWILFSDQIAASIAPTQEALKTISLYKGWGYVLVTAFMLYLLIRRDVAAMRASEQQLRKVIDAMPAFIAYVGADRRYQFTNKAYQEWFGDQTQGKHIEEIMGKAAYRRLSKYIDKALAGETVSYDAEVPYHDRELFMDIRYVPDTAANGQINGFYVMALDRTAQKQAEEERKLWADAFDGCAHGIAIGNPHSHRIMACNPAFASMHKSRVEDIVGSAILSLYEAADHQHVRRNIEKADQIGHARFEANMIRRDGSAFPVQMDLVSVLGGDGELLHRVATAQDISERKRAEAAALASETRYHRVLDTMMEGCQIIDYSWRYVYVNAVAAQQGQHEPQELLGHTMMEMYPGIENTELFSTLRQCMEERAPRRMENQFTFPNGDIGWFELSIQPVEEGIFILSTDITERRQSEENLRRFELLSQNSRDIILFMRADDGQILEANAAAMQAYGYSHSELLGLTIQKLRDEKTHQVTAKQMAQAGTEGILFETVHKRKDGTTFPVEVSSRGAVIGGARTLISIVRDITGRKRAERALQASQERLSFALEKSHTGGWDLDLVDHTALRTLEHDRIFGYETLLPEWTYEMFLDHVIAEDRAEVDRLFQKAVNTQTDWNFECRIRRKDGEICWIWAVGGHLFNEAGRARRMAGIVQDITARKQADEQIRRLNEELEKRVAERTAQLEVANKELESFSYSVSHDLRAPLRAIDGYAHILVEDYASTLDAEGKRICGVISTEARRMGQLIDDLLAFSRFGRKELRASSIEMRALVVSVLNDLLTEEDREHIDFKVRNLPPVKGDPSLMRQVWVNLLANAIKFTSRKDERFIEVGSRSGSSEITYYVRDNGAGFDMEYADKLFGVFQRLHSADEFDGTGVGLAIVQRIIHRHGGRVWAEGETDRGATFYFSLPRKE